MLKPSGQHLALQAAAISYPQVLSPSRQGPPGAGIQQAPSPEPPAGTVAGSRRKHTGFFRFTAAHRALKIATGKLRSAAGPICPDPVG